MIPCIRVQSQQLIDPAFDTPRELVRWMGAIQAQDYNMAKWAIGVRLKSETISAVDQAIERGEIMRTHVMRPTWHFVLAENLRWMLKLSAKRINSSLRSRDKALGITEDLYTKVNLLLEKTLIGSKSLTRQEIGAELEKKGIIIDSSRMIHFMIRAEVEGVVCNGIDRGKQTTYALIEERIASTKELHKEEALAKLALSYFRSHSPASLNDFVWWSGLSVVEARQAIDFIKGELITERLGDQFFYIHQLYGRQSKSKETVQFLPGYDEYLISYKDRSTVMELDHYSHAFTKFGIFYPVIMHNGRIVGKWAKSIKKGQLFCETTFFEQGNNIDKELLGEAWGRYVSFNTSQV